MHGHMNCERSLTFNVVKICEVTMCLRHTLKFDWVFDKVVTKFPTAHARGGRHAHYLGSPDWKVRVSASNGTCRGPIGP